MPLQEYTIPPPFGGLDLVSPINAMPAEVALELKNVFPGATAPITRKGYEQYCDVSANSTTVDTLFPYNTQTGTTELIAVCGGSTRKIYKIIGGTATDITGTTAIGATGTNMTCQQFRSRLYMCNGVDAVQVYDGSTVADSTFTGVTLANLINVSTYKFRLYFVEKNSTKFWYGNTNAVGASALNSYDIDGVISRGGRLVFAGSYTNNLGQSSQDLFFAVTSEGEIIFFAGSAPDSDAWGMVAKFYIGKPLGYRAFLRINNDVWIITEQGIIPVSALFQADPEQAVNVISAKVNPYITTAAVVTPFSQRWHGWFWPQGRRVFINVPTSETETTMLVYSIDTRAWCVYELVDKNDSISVVVAGSTPYYGATDGKIYTGETGFTDKGFDINFCLRTSFSYMGPAEAYKAFKDIRPLLKTKKGLVFQLAIDTDFKDTASGDTINTGAAVTTPWGSAWGSPWASNTEYIFNRYSVRGQGHAAALEINGTLNSSQCEFFGFELRYDAGSQV